MALTKRCRNRYCKIHYYWDFNARWHLPFPVTVNVLSSRYGWQQRSVFVGPSAYYPSRPTMAQWEVMRWYCLHIQGDLTCNACLRHTFRPREFP